MVQTNTTYITGQPRTVTCQQIWSSTEDLPQKLEQLYVDKTQQLPASTVCTVHDVVGMVEARCQVLAVCPMQSAWKQPQIQHQQLTRSQHSKECKDPRQHCFLTCDFDLLTPKQISFQDSSWNICMSSLVIRAASVFEISCDKADTQTSGGENPNPWPPSAWVTNSSSYQHSTLILKLMVRLVQYCLSNYKIFSTNKEPQRIQENGAVGYCCHQPSSIKAN